MSFPSVHRKPRTLFVLLSTSVSQEIIGSLQEILWVVSF